MAYTMEQFQKDHFLRKLPQFLNNDKIQDGIFQTISNNWTANLIMENSGQFFLSRILSQAYPQVND